MLGKTFLAVSSYDGTEDSNRRAAERDGDDAPSQGTPITRMLARLLGH